MLRSLAVENLTVFANVELAFSEGLNVFIGGNGSGKTHLLKMLYALPAASWEEYRRSPGTTPTKAALQKRLADKIVGVFRPDALGRLARRVHGRSRCAIRLGFFNEQQDLSLRFSTGSTTEVTLDALPSALVGTAPAYIPTRELLTIYPNFVSIYEGRFLDFEETWRDTCILLGMPLRRGPRDGEVSEMLAPIEDAMQGRIELDQNGRFYLRTDTGRIEMPLVAEGVRKLGMIAYLVVNGALSGTGCLFWDEPEANLNPRLIRQAARTIFALSRNGTQVFIATHSLFLLRELEILLSEVEGRSRLCSFFGLHATADGTNVVQGESLEDVGDILSLDEELSQSDRFFEASQFLAHA